MNEAGDLAAPEISRRAERMHRAHGEGLVFHKAAQARRRATYNSHKGEISEPPGEPAPTRGRDPRLRGRGPGRLVVTDVTEFRLDGYRAHPSSAIDCFDG